MQLYRKPSCTKGSAFRLDIYYYWHLSYVSYPSYWQVSDKTSCLEGSAPSRDIYNNWHLSYVSYPSYWRVWNNTPCSEGSAPSRDIHNHWHLSCIISIICHIDKYQTKHLAQRAVHPAVTSITINIYHVSFPSYWQVSNKTSTVSLLHRLTFAPSHFCSVSLARSTVSLLHGPPSHFCTADDMSHE